MASTATPCAKNFHLHIVKYDHYTWGEQIGLARYLYRLKADLVHFIMPQQPLLYTKTSITTVHDLTLVHWQNLDKNKLIYTVEQTIFKYLLKRVSKRSKFVIVSTNYVKKDLLKFVNINPTKVIVTYQATEPLTKARPEPIEQLVDKPFLLYVGNAFPYKNLKRLVEAFVLLKKDHSDLQLVLTGKKEFFYKQIEEFAKQQAVSDIHFLDFVSDEALSWLYQKADAYVFPSLSEGFGLPGLEAMQYKVPVISSDATCLPEVYEQAAHYFNGTDKDDMARAIHEVLSNQSLRQFLIEKGNQQILKHSWSELAQKTHQLYKQSL